MTLEHGSDGVELPEVELSIVMPCLNEADTLGPCLEAAHSFLECHGVSGEVIVADNGSSDGSQEIAKRYGARVTETGTRGYGAALATGIAAARGKYVIMGDSDSSYDFSSLMPFIEKLREGADLVVGNRFWGGIRPGAMPWLHQHIGNPLLSKIGRMFFRSPCRDFYCGLRGFRRDAVLAMDLRSIGMEFALEMIVKATMMGMRIAEVPTTLSPDGRNHPSHLRTWRDGWRSLRFYLLYSPRWLFFYPGLALIALGTALGLWILPSTRTIGNVTLEVHTLLYCAAAIFLGFQAVSFSLFSKILATSTGLHPRSPRAEKWLGVARLEVGLGLGLGFVVLGFVGSLIAVWWWGLSEFSHLDPFRGMRVVIPSVLALILGSQIILSSFYLSLLRMHSSRAWGKGSDDDGPASRSSD